MKIITSQEDLDTAKYDTPITLECSFCKSYFQRPYKEVKHALKTRPNINFCSNKCYFDNRKSGKTITCKNCGQKSYKKLSELKYSDNFFCCQSCAATYNNTHKKHGHRRSKLESYLEKQLIILYPNLEIHFNKKDAINSELDIYIPSLKLAIELNGIFHYEPIYGAEKLSQIQNNDNRKFQACLERGIELCIIDTSKISYFKESTSKPILDIITNLINQKWSIRSDLN